MKKILCALFVLGAGSAFAQHTYKSYVKDEMSYREHVLDITRMKVEVNFDAQKGKVIGKVTHSFNVLRKQVDSVFFDAPGITIKSAQLGNQNLPFNTVKEGVWVKPSTALKMDYSGTITFEYEATPRKGIYFIGWNVPENPNKSPFAVRKQIWTQGQGTDNRYWIPMYDELNDKFITETVVTFDSDYEVLSNGVLLKKSINKNNTTTWHYSMSKPHAGYLLMLGIGKYGIKKTKSASGVPLSLYYYPDFKERAEPTYRYSEEMIDFMEQETGIKYPWESYSQIMVQDFLYGAMENTTATVFGDFFNVDERAFIDRNYIGVNVHELAHQWFGDYITARDWRDTWLQESWATYYPKMFTRKIYGEDAYNWQRRGEQLTALEASKKDLLPIRHSGAGTARVYPKGSNVISMLTYVLGDEEWKRSLAHYLKKHAYSNVETNDLVQAIQDKTGRDLNWFFDQWVYRGGEPKYAVKYNDVTTAGNQRITEITVEQVHAQNEQVSLFKMPIVFQVYYKDGSTDSLTQWIAAKHEVVRVPNKQNKDIAFVLFDPNGMILKQVEFKKEFNELKAQLQNAPYMLDRYDALVAMKDIAVDVKKEVLLQSFKKEVFHAIRSEIITQLCNDEQSALQLTSCFSQQDPQPKLAFIKTYQGNNAEVIKAMEALLNDASYEVVQTAVEKLCALNGANKLTYLNAVKNTYGMHNSVNIKYHELCVINDIDVAAHSSALIDYTSNQWEFRTRNAAFASIKTINVCNEQLIANLFDAVLSTNSRLAGPAADLANYLAVQQKNIQAMRAYYNAQNYTKDQKEIIKKYLPTL
jgi:aminopeptidase N